MTPRLHMLSTLAALLALSGCDSKPPPPPPPIPPIVATADSASTPNAPPTLTAESLGSIDNLHIYEQCYLAGQPSAEDFKLLEQRGVKAVINLRPHSESSFDEKAAVEKLGMKYYNVPFAQPDTLTDEVFGEVRRLLKSTEGPIVMHCGSANRVGAVWLAKRVLDDGVEFDAALTESKIVGLRSQSLIDRARQYIKAQQSPPPAP